MKLSSLKKRLGDILVDVGIITPEQLKEALETQRITGEKLGTILAQMGAINEEVMLAFLGKQCGVSYISISEYGDIPVEVIKSIPESLARHQTLIPIASEGNTITIAMSDPFNVFAIDDIKVMTGYDVNVVIASESDIKQAINKYYSFKFEQESTTITNLLKKNPKATGKEMLDSIIIEAVRNKSSDIHIEPGAESFNIRFRIDGILHEHSPLALKYYQMIINEIKKEAGLNSEAFQSQEGQLKFKLEHGDIDARVSMIKTVTGEKATIQILGNDSLCRDLIKLGFETETLALYKKNIESQNGLILIASPICSGKTTTLYSTMSYLNSPDRSIVSIEDTVRCVVQGVTQVQVNNSEGFTYPEAIRNAQKQNPDILFIDEVHDQEAAKLAINSAITGHLVFATLSIVDSVGSLSHLINMGIEPFMVTSTVKIVLAQRLMRVICPECKESYQTNIKNLNNIGINVKMPDNAETVSLFRGKGCKNCNQTGYLGRLAIYEVLELNDKLRDLILQKAPETVLRQATNEIGIVNLREAAWRKVKSGVSTAEEMIRITKYSD